MKIATIGFSGSGKSYIASIFHKYGFCWLRTDEIRKSLFGSLYDQQTTKEVYKELIERAKLCGNTILDGAFLKKWQRDMFIEAFPEDYFFILIKTEEDVIKKRLAHRKDISDADFNIYLLQKKTFEPPDEIPKDKIMVVENNHNDNVEDVILYFLKAKNLYLA